MTWSELTLIWAAILAFAVFAYAILDGFDLGIGLLFLAFKPNEERARVISAIAPVWDGNETWLVFGGAGLMSAFPTAYGVLLPALYAPVTAMLLGLVLRGIAFEFRANTTNAQSVWDVTFALGSFVASMTQGIMVGAVIQGISTSGSAYAGGWWDWLTPFSIACGLALTLAYASLGACWLVMKTQDETLLRARRLALALATPLAAAIPLAGAWLAEIRPEYMQRWDGSALAMLAASWIALTALYVSKLRRRPDHWPFILVAAMVSLGFVVLGRSLYPKLIPPSLTIWETHAPAESLVFLLIGAVILIPITIAYTAHAYWAFRGKVSDPSVHAP